VSVVVTLSSLSSMRFRDLAAAGIIAAFVSPLQASAQSPRDSLLVTAQWLSQHIKDPNVVILHVGPRPSYDSAHVPGARFVDLDRIALRGSPTLELPQPDSLRAALIDHGISDDSRIVVVQGSGWVTPATRVVLTLDHAGLGAKTVLLDGGQAAWARAGFETTAAVPAPSKGKLSALRTKVNIVDGEFVRNAKGNPNIVLVDARNQGFYDGVQESGPEGNRKRGHIPGAKSIPFNTLMISGGELLSAAALAEKFAAAGVKKGDSVIAYCHIGQQATLVVFAARTLGIDVKLYDGSFEDWVVKGWPVDVPPAKAP
jgi:thiosulfate/3-mercaptopyruvate sulfurtransferase